MKPLAKKKPIRVKRVIKKSKDARAKDSYILHLFVAGATDRSHLAVLRVRELCRTILKDRVKLNVIDIYQQPSLAHEHQIVATPTLIIQMPLPVRRFIGNLANISDLFSLLDLGEKGSLIL